MKIFLDRYISLIALPVLVAALLFAACTPCQEASFYCTGESSCFREWVGALSGWVAASTILILLRQLKTQQQQTNFQLGDALPTFDAIQHTGQINRIDVTIYNWNRRPIHVRQLSVPYCQVPITMLSVASDEARPQFAHSHSGQPCDLRQAALIEGWVDRTRPPPSRRLNVVACHENSDYPFEEEWRSAQVRIDYELIGNPDPLTAIVPVHMTTAPSPEAQAFE